MSERRESGGSGRSSQCEAAALWRWLDAMKPIAAIEGGVGGRSVQHPRVRFTAIAVVFRALAWRAGFLMRAPAPEPQRTFVPGPQQDGESEMAWRCRMRTERYTHDRTRLAARPWLGWLYPEWAADIASEFSRDTRFPAAAHDRAMWALTLDEADASKQP